MCQKHDRIVSSLGLLGLVENEASQEEVSVDNVYFGRLEVESGKGIGTDLEPSEGSSPLNRLSTTRRFLPAALGLLKLLTKNALLEGSL